MREERIMNIEFLLTRWIQQLKLQQERYSKNSSNLPHLYLYTIGLHCLVLACILPHVAHVTL